MSTKGNGIAKSWLLWVNTILTAGAAFIGGRLWDKIDHLNNQQIRYEEKVDTLVKQQQAISREHHAIFFRLDKIEKLKP